MRRPPYIDLSLSWDRGRRRKLSAGKRPGLGSGIYIYVIAGRFMLALETT